MPPVVSRCRVLLVVALVAIGSTMARAAEVSPAYEEAFRSYESGDPRAAVTALERAWTGDPDDALLLGLARLELDEPARAAEAWAQFIRKSDDARLVAEVRRLRTIVVREANRRAAAQAVAAGEDGAPAVSSDVLAVVPFQNVGAPIFAPLGKAIAAMLTDNLGGVPTAQVIGRGRVEAYRKAVGDAGGETAAARRAGRLLGAGMVVVGAHVDTASDPRTLEVTSAMIDTTSGERVEAGLFLAPLDRFYVTVRDTAVALASRLGWPVGKLTPASAARVQAEHTRSLEAALAFGRGLDLEDRGDFEAARGEYEEAVRRDASFRLARERLSTLPAATMSLAGVAAAVRPELPAVETPAVVAAAEEPEPSPSALPTATPAVVAVLATASPAAGPVPVPPPPADREDEDDEETTFLGMSPTTALLVGGGAALAIGGAAAALGGGGGGGDGGGDDPVRPPTLGGVQNRTVSAGDLVALDVEGQDPEGSTVVLSVAGAPAAATFDTSSGNPATGAFRWQTTASDGGQTLQVTFTATATRGPPNDTTSASATLSVLAAPPTPTPPPACGGTGATCASASECCQDVARGCEVTPAGGGTRCCLPIEAACQVDGDCCGSDSACSEQRCCRPLGATCEGAAECCGDAAACPSGRCCLPDGLACQNDGECCNGRCNDEGVCEVVAPPTPTPSPTPAMCLPEGEACDTVVDCCPGTDCDVTPTSNETLCCAPLGSVCDDESTCCGADVGCDDVCCLPIGSLCSDATECCGNGAGCVLGRCCAAPGQDCQFDTDCCAGSCAGGTCSAELVAGGTPAPTPSPTPRATPTPTPSPTPTPDRASPF